jgi:hypothetical protein
MSDAGADTKANATANARANANARNHITVATITLTHMRLTAIDARAIAGADAARRFAVRIVYDVRAVCRRRHNGAASMQLVCARPLLRQLSRQ